jgi:hypothetical protein
MRVQLCFSLVLAAVSVAGSARPARAQSLGDIGRQEEERRKEVKTPAKVYTNKDLGTPSQTSAAPATPAAGTPGASGTPDKPPAPAADNKDSAVKDQKYWSGRKATLAAKLERDRVLADAMQSRINQLTADFSARSDPAQRAVLERDRQRAVSEFDGLQKAVKDDQKALADFDEEARKASVPPGWLR